MLLVNGARGIGTGYSTFIPPCNPKDLKTRLMKWLQGDAHALDGQIHIYYEGFKGLYYGGDHASGTWKKVKEGEYLVTELPPGTWTQDYREWLEKELTEGRIKDYVDTSTDKDVHIVIRGIHENTLTKSLDMHARLSNMHAFNAKGQITKYPTLNAILKEYAEVRLALYETRRQHQIRAMEAELPYHENVMRFIQDQCEDAPQIVLKKKSRAECDATFAKFGYAQIDGSYDYLMRLPVSSFTREQMDKHHAKLDDLRSSIAKLWKTTAADLWLTELSAL
jgi:DNA topoisomerase-2